VGLGISRGRETYYNFGLCMIISKSTFLTQGVEEESNASAALDVRGRRRVGYDEDKVVIMGRGITASCSYFQVSAIMVWSKRLE
jgi:hypothetical protein